MTGRRAVAIATPFAINSMKVGIVGFPGAGKTTIFNALTGLRADTGAGARTRDNVGVIKVPDARVERLAAMHNSRKKVYAEVVFVDVAPSAPGSAARNSSKGGLPAAVLQAMQGCDALVLVLRAFDNPALAEPADPLRELRDFQTELILSDLAPLENRRDRLGKEGGEASELALLQRSIAHLEGGQPLASLTLTPRELSVLAGFGALSNKPVLGLLNEDERDFTGAVPATLAAGTAAQEPPLMTISGKIEMEIAALAPAEQPEFLAAMGLESSARERFVQRAYELLMLITFFTTRSDESRAWPIRRGATALKAAGKVHSDMERGFIRAEVVAYEEFAKLGSEAKCREAGKLRLEGKEYLVQDGDIIHFRFNV